MMKIIRFGLGACLGAFVSGTIVLLLTPVSGKVFRERMIGLVNNFAKEVQDAGIQKRAELEAEIKNLSQPR
jgi:gas vesicle protein